MTECTDHGWYATHRAKVEADFAAAEAAGADHEDQGPRIHGDDMDRWLAWQSKREAAAKEAPIRNPLADPEYPALMAEALAQAKDGD